MAYLVIGAYGVKIDDLGCAPADAGPPSRRHRLGTVVRQITGRVTPLALGSAQHTASSYATRAATAVVDDRDRSVFGDPTHRHRRPADFVVRLAPYPSGAPGQAMAVTVDMDQAHFFDERGQRIDVGWR